MKLFYLLLSYISWAAAIPLQKPLRSGAQLDWTNADCFPGGRKDGNNTICIQKVWEPVFDGEIIGGPIIDQFCGYMALGPGSNPFALFFWVVLSEGDPANDPIVLWMNGGPGASSLFGLLDQWGPRTMDHNQRPRVVFKDNQFRMTEKLTWVFLEQPSGTGFSTGRPNIEDSGTAAKDVSEFIEALLHPDTKFNFKGTQLALTGRELHIAGESYAGHWIPAVGSHLIKTNKHTKVKLKSVLIGSAFTDVALMGDAVNKLLCGPSPPLTLDHTTPADIAARCSSMPTWKRNCDKAIKECRKSKALCDAAVNTCIESWGEGWAERFNKNIYDVSKDMASKLAEREFLETHLALFMNNADRRIRLGVTGGPLWQPFNTDMRDNFLASGDWSRSYIPEIQNILNKDIDVLLYAGDLDLKCPFTLVKQTALNTNWNEAGGTKRERFRKCAARGENTYKKFFAPPSQPYGNYIRAGHLTYARIFKAGHMINEKKPREAKNLFENWIFSRAFFEECDPGP